MSDLTYLIALYLMQKKPKPVLFDDLDLRRQCEQVLSYIIHFKDNSIRKQPTNFKEWPS
jgi:hypothetical protein